MKSLLFTSAARKQFKALPLAIQDEIRAKLLRYAETGAGDVTKLQGQPGARIRIRDYRVIFVETDTEIVVRAAGHRRDVYG